MLRSIILSAWLFISASFPQQARAQFRYQPAKVATGTVYHYVKTNIDGTAPENVSVYLVAPDSVVAFKFHPGAERAGLVGAKLDWNLFCATRLSSWQLFYTGEKRLFATLEYLPSEQAARVEIVGAGLAPEKVAMKRVPFHVYNFDLVSLNLALPHLLAPKKSFVIGIADPTFAEGAPVFAYKGEAEIKFLGEEKRGGVACRKYAINGAGLQNRGGVFWVDQERGHIVDVEIALPNNPEWQSYKLRLLNIAKMNQSAWEAFIEDQF